MMGRAAPPVAPITVPRKSLLKMPGFSEVGIFSKTRRKTPGLGVYGRPPGIFRRTVFSGAAAGSIDGGASDAKLVPPHVDIVSDRRGLQVSDLRRSGVASLLLLFAAGCQSQSAQRPSALNWR